MVSVCGDDHSSGMFSATAAIRPDNSAADQKHRVLLLNAREWELKRCEVTLSPPGWGGGWWGGRDADPVLKSQTVREPLISEH